MMTSSRSRVAILDKLPGKHFETPDIEQEALGDAALPYILRSHSIDDIMAPLGDADALIVWSRFRLDAGVLARLPRCRGIVCASIGYEHVDLEFAADRGITVCNVPDYCTEEVADHTMAMILALVRKLRLLHECVSEGSWDWQDAGPIMRLRDVVLGLVGFGRIGMAVARRAQVFGMSVAFHDPYVPSGVEKSLGVQRCESLHTLLDTAQVVSLHALANDETRNLIGKSELARLTPGTILVNTARGALIDEAALLEAWASGVIGGLGLDVLADEPRVPSLLAESPRVIVTPHAAWYSTESFMENRRKSATAARHILAGNPVRDTVNRQTHSTQGKAI